MYSGKAVAAGISGRAKLIPDITPENMATGMLTQWLSIKEWGHTIIVKLMKMLFHRITFFNQNI